MFVVMCRRPKQFPAFAEARWKQPPHQCSMTRRSIVSTMLLQGHSAQCRQRWVIMHKTYGLSFFSAVSNRTEPWWMPSAQNRGQREAMTPADGQHQCTCSCAGSQFHNNGTVSAHLPCMDIGPSPQVDGSCCELAHRNGPVPVLGDQHHAVWGRCRTGQIRPGFFLLWWRW